MTALTDDHAALADDEFTLDLRVVELVSPFAVLPCDTDDACGSTCAPSACSTSSNDPS